MNLKDLILQHLPMKKKPNPSGFYINCPMCTQMGQTRNDTKFRGGFTPKPDGGFVYHCYNCNFATGWEADGIISKNLMRFMTTIGIDKRDIPLSLRLLKPGERAKTVNFRKTHDMVREFDTVPMLNGARPISALIEQGCDDPDFIQVCDYLLSRGDRIVAAQDYWWSADKHHAWNKRFIIPFMHRKKLVGYMGRLAIQGSNFPKYYGNTPSDYMFNQEYLEQEVDYPVIICEGVLDAIAIDGVAVLGKVMSPRQINLINWSKRPKILIPDFDKDGERMVHDALENGWQVSVPDWDLDIKDAADATKKYGVLYALKSIIDGATHSRVKALTRFKMKYRQIV